LANHVYNFTDNKATNLCHMIIKFSWDLTKTLATGDKTLVSNSSNKRASTKSHLSL